MLLACASPIGNAQSCKPFLPPTIVRPTPVIIASMPGRSVATVVALMLLACASPIANAQSCKDIRIESVATVTTGCQGTGCVEVLSFDPKTQRTAVVMSRGTIPCPAPEV
eukprot:gene28960-32153_t